MNKILVLSCFFVIGCGGPNNESGPAPNTTVPATPTPEKVAVITEEDLLLKRWTAVDNGKYVMIDLERAFGTDRNMFHLRFCEEKPCNDYLFFAVGTFNLNPNNQLCFSDVNYWNPPPEGFFVQSSEPFCGTGVLKDGTMTVDFLTTQGQKTLRLTSEPLEF
jgi:hypothetical protein